MTCVFRTRPTCWQHVATDFISSLLWGAVKRSCGMTRHSYSSSPASRDSTSGNELPEKLVFPMVEIRVNFGG